jgi:hypothetical protein
VVDRRMKETLSRVHKDRRLIHILDGCISAMKWKVNRSNVSDSTIYILNKDRAQFKYRIIKKR